MQHFIHSQEPALIKGMGVQIPNSSNIYTIYVHVHVRIYVHV